MAKKMASFVPKKNLEKEGGHNLGTPYPGN